jgi:hypothetical protein
LKKIVKPPGSGEGPATQNGYPLEKQLRSIVPRGLGRPGPCYKAVPTQTKRKKKMGSAEQNEAVSDIVKALLNKSALSTSGNIQSDDNHTSCPRVIVVR